MKIKTQKTKPRYGDKAKLANTATDAVIYLPEDTVDQAKLAMEASTIEAGDTSDLQPAAEPAPASFVEGEGSNDLMEAATLGDDPVIDPAPPLGEPIDASASLTDLEAEVVARELQAANKDKEPVEVTLSELSLHFIRDIGERLKPTWLKIVAWGNDVRDWTDKLNCKIKIAFEFYRDQVVEWSLNRVAEYEEWAAQQEAKRNFVRDEIGKINARLAAMEKAVDRSTKQAVDPAKLDKFVRALQQGRNANAANLHRELTGSTLAGAKLAVEALVAA
jgi:hypothetical protein